MIHDNRPVKSSMIDPPTILVIFALIAVFGCYVYFVRFADLDRRVTKYENSLQVHSTPEDYQNEQKDTAFLSLVCGRVGK